MRTIDERVVRSPVGCIFDLARDVERWPEYLPHYRHVRFRERRADGGGIVDMSANRPFAVLSWPTWWRSLMQVVDGSPAGSGQAGAGDVTPPAIRFRHVGGITTGMDVEWSFASDPAADSTVVRIVHVWDGPPWPLIGPAAAIGVIGPVFVHGIASRTLAGLAAVAEHSGARTGRGGGPRNDDGPSG